jgi:preprotein translocase subunit SecB
MMDINQVKSNLKMENLYFSKCSVERNAYNSGSDFEINIDKKISKVSDHVFDVMIKLTAITEHLKLEIIANARFIFESDDYSEEETIVNKNTVAIMFPFIRSQVTLMTSQPGMMPIVLQPINTAKLK